MDGEWFHLLVHLPATVGVLVWAWLERRAAFPLLRDTFVATQTLTMAANALAPVAPPRMLERGAAALAYPIVVLLVIVATANHLWLDALAAALVTGAAFAGAAARRERGLRLGSVRATSTPAIQSVTGRP